MFSARCLEIKNLNKKEVTFIKLNLVIFTYILLLNYYVRIATEKNIYVLRKTIYKWGSKKINKLYQVFSLILLL